MMMVAKIPMMVMIPYDACDSMMEVMMIMSVMITMMIVMIGMTMMVT